MTARDAFSLSTEEWEDVEASFGEVAEMKADQMLANLLHNSTPDQQKWLALGIMCGRASK